VRLTDRQLADYVAAKLALPGDQRNELRQQVNRLLDHLVNVLHADGSFKIQRFRKAGSLEKGTTNRARAGKPVDADVGVYFDFDDPSHFDVASLQQLIKELLVEAYPQKSPDDFDDSGSRTFGVLFKGTGLEVDLVPIVALDHDGDYGFQYSRSGDCVKTSVKTHIGHYRAHAQIDPFLSEQLRMVKRWSYWQELDGIQSFHLELALSYLLDRYGKPPSIEEGFRRFFRFIVRDLGDGVTFGTGNISSFVDPVVILDPANASNNVAARVELKQRDRLIDTAKAAYETITLAQGLQYEGETIALWKELLGDSFAVD
jgi:hypothetical protein